jgi:hypothetical protein
MVIYLQDARILPILVEPDLLCCKIWVLYTISLLGCTNECVRAYNAIGMSMWFPNLKNRNELIKGKSGRFKQQYRLTAGTHDHIRPLVQQSPVQAADPRNREEGRQKQGSCAQK